MTKDEALDLALEALEDAEQILADEGYGHAFQQEAITAIKQARSHDKKADNAREFGLDYEIPMQDRVWPEKFQDRLRDESYSYDADVGMSDLIKSLYWLENSPNTRDKLAAKELKRLHEANIRLKNCLFQMQEAAKQLATQPVQEPVAWLDSDGFPWNKEGIECRTTKDTYTPLYATPPQRKPLQVDKDGWYWLSKNECIHVDLIRKVEEAHGIK